MNTTSPVPIEVVLIDLGGVIADVLPERRLQALSELSGLPEALLQERIFDSGFDHLAERGAYKPEQVFAYLDKALEQPVARTDLIEAWAQAFEPRPDLLALIPKVPCARVLFTNNGPIMDSCLEGPLAVVTAPLTKVVCSWHVNAAKPDHEAFRRVAGLFGLRPDHLLLLDDTAANVEAARVCGWDAERVSNAEEMRAALAARNLLR